MSENKQQRDEKMTKRDSIKRGQRRSMYCLCQCFFVCFFFLRVVSSGSLIFSSSPPLRIPRTAA